MRPPPPPPPALKKGASHLLQHHIPSFYRPQLMQELLTRRHTRRINAFLDNVDVGEHFVHGELEAYSCECFRSLPAVSRGLERTLHRDGCLMPVHVNRQSSVCPALRQRDRSQARPPPPPPPDPWRVAGGHCLTRRRHPAGKLAGLDKKLSRSLEAEVQEGSSPQEMMGKSPVGPLSESSRSACAGSALHTVNLS